MHKASRIVIVLVTLLVGVGLDRAVGHSGPQRPHPRLETLPLIVGPWRGIPGMLSPDILAALRPDDYLLRQYRMGGGAPLTLYLAYYDHQHLNERVHSPSACLPAGGWLPVDVGYQEIAVPGGSSPRISANRFLIEKGANRQVVLYWFQGRGRVVANDVKASLYLAYDTLRGRGSDETLVRVSASVRGSPGDTLAEEVRFVQRFYPLLHKFLSQFLTG